MVSNLRSWTSRLWMVNNEPVTNYFIRSGIIFMNDVGVMLLIFIPKLSSSASDPRPRFGRVHLCSKTATGSNSTSTGASSHSE